VLSGDWSEEWGRSAAMRLLTVSRRVPDAIFCGNDQIARGVVDGLRERGVGVPDDVAVVGFDNWQIIAEASRPPLTTVDMNLAQLGREAGRRLIDLIAGKKHVGVHRLPCSLVVRASCGGLAPARPRRRDAAA
jgi:LacI family transcriptional regulator